MAKIAITYSLSEDLVEYVENYKKEHKLKNRSAALERILLETKTKDDVFKLVLDELKSSSNDNNNTSKPIEEKVKEVINISSNNSNEEAFTVDDKSEEFDFMKNSIQDIMFNMPDE